MSFSQDIFFGFFENILASEAAQSTSAGSRNIFDSLKSAIPMIIIMVVFYFLLIVPQNRKKRKQEEMISSIQKGEEVLTSSGIFGKVVRIDDKTASVLVEVSKGVEMKILKNQIVNITSRNSTENYKNKTPIPS